MPGTESTWHEADALVPVSHCIPEFFKELKPWLRLFFTRHTVSWLNAAWKKLPRVVSYTDFDKRGTNVGRMFPPTVQNQRKTSQKIGIRQISAICLLFKQYWAREYGVIRRLRKRFSEQVFKRKESTNNLLNRAELQKRRQKKWWCLKALFSAILTKLKNGLFLPKSQTKQQKSCQTFVFKNVKLFFCFEHKNICSWFIPAHLTSIRVLSPKRQCRVIIFEMRTRQFDGEKNAIINFFDEERRI